MKKRKPKAGDVYINIHGEPVPFPIILLPRLREEDNNLGLDHDLIAHLLNSDYHPTCPSFAEYGVPIGAILSNDKFQFLFNLNTKELEDVIVKKYLNGDFNSSEEEGE